MQFVIDKVFEDSFYGNLLLGLPETLACLGIDDTYISREAGVLESDITQWEFKHGIRLPEDLRNFYAATDGFLYMWTLAEPDEAGDTDAVCGKIEINPFTQYVQLSLLNELETKGTPDVSLSGKRYELKLGVESKVFELVKVEELGKVVVVYLQPHLSPTIWFCTTTTDFHFLANDFTIYLRMAIAHLGIPEWQMLFTPQGVSETCLELFQVLAPHLLPSKNKADPPSLACEKQLEDEYTEPLNEIDSDFLVYPKNAPVSSSGTIVDLCTPVPLKKQEKKKMSVKYRPPTKIKRKPLYYIKH